MLDEFIFNPLDKPLDQLPLICHHFVGVERDANEEFSIEMKKRRMEEFCELAQKSYPEGYKITLGYLPPHERSEWELLKIKKELSE